MRCVPVVDSAHNIGRRRHLIPERSCTSTLVFLASSTLGQCVMSTRGITRTPRITFIEASEIEICDHVGCRSHLNGKTAEALGCQSLPHHIIYGSHTTALASLLLPRFLTTRTRMDRAIMHNESLHRAPRNRHMELFFPRLVQTASKIRIRRTLGDECVNLFIDPLKRSVQSLHCETPCLPRLSHRISRFPAGHLLCYYIRIFAERLRLLFVLRATGTASAVRAFVAEDATRVVPLAIVEVTL